MRYDHVAEKEAEHRLHVRHVHSRTMPGTDTNVTPEIEAPIMPKETTYQGDLFSPLKNAAFDPPLCPVMWAINNNPAK